MKILFIHLSDIHFKNNFDINIDNFLTAIEPYKNVVDECFLVFSGDFSFSGSTEEIAIFDTFITKMISSLNSILRIETKLLIVPGNHDIILDKDTCLSREQIESLSSADKEKAYRNELIKQQNSLEYCSSKGFDFSKSSLVNKLFDFGRTAVNVNLVNSAPFSSLGSKDFDKGSHYLFPFGLSVNGCIRLGKKTLEVLICHHRPDWFDYNSQQELEEYEKTTASICFYGHEHKADSYYEVNNENQVVISRGGFVNNANLKLSGSFVTLLVDDEFNICTITTYTSSKRTSMFECSDQKKISIKYNDKYALNNKFIDSILNPVLVDGVREKDVFIMNFLSSNGEQEDIYDFKALIDFIDKNKKLFLVGQPKIGKSVLLHRIFEHYSLNAETCIYYDCEERTSKNTLQNIKNIFDDQYKMGDELYKEFSTGQNRRRVLIVDNFDSFDRNYKKEAFKKDIENHFDIFIFASKTNFSDKRELLDDFYASNLSFKLNGFSVVQRHSFLKKYLTIKGIDDNDSINKINGAIESSIATCSILDMSDPGYLLLLADQIVKNKLYVERETYNAFSVVFDYSIHDALANAGNKADLDAYDLILSKLALEMNFVKHDIYFEYVDLDNAVRFGKKNFTHVKNIDTEEMLDILLKSKLVKKHEGKYKFVRNSIFAYFASKEVIRLVKKKDTKYLKIISDNILYGINGDIFVFVAYNLRDNELFFEIQDTLSKLLNNFEPLSFEKKNNPILKANKTLIPENKEQAENRKQFFARIDAAERKVINNADKKEAQAYETTFDGEASAILKIFKLIEISCKIIAGFPNDLEQDDRQVLFECTLESSLKIINMLFRFNDEKEIEEIEREFKEAKKQFIDNLIKNNSDRKTIEKIENLDIVHAFYSVLTSTVLNIFTSMANICASKVSMPIIADLDGEIFSNLLFKLISYGETANFEGFKNTLKAIIELKNKEYTLLAQRVLRVFVVKHDLTNKQIKELSAVSFIPEIKLLQYK